MKLPNKILDLDSGKLGKLCSLFPAFRCVWYDAECGEGWMRDEQNNESLADGHKFVPVYSFVFKIFRFCKKCKLKD